jgi:hypothetical protein
MKKVLPFFVFLLSLTITSVFATGVLYAQTPRPASKSAPSPAASVSPTPSLDPTLAPTPRTDITQKTEESVGPLEKLLAEQALGPVWPKNPLKYAIRSAIDAGVPANTIVLLLLLPVVAALIAAARHLIGLRGFGIFLPAALAVTFVAIGPVLGILLFLVIIFFSTFFRMVTRKLKLKLQYLPRMAMLLWFVVLGVLGVLFLAPVIKQPDLSNISIFPVLILVLLAEDFSRVQIGKSAKTAVNLTTETLILALASFLFLTLESLQQYALLNPEIFLLLVLAFDFIVGKYVGLRFMEYWRFRKLISSS